MNFTDYLQRAELVSIENFLRTGGEACFKTDSKTYFKQLNKAYSNLNKLFEEHCSHAKDFEKTWMHFMNKYAYTKMCFTKLV